MTTSYATISESIETLRSSYNEKVSRPFFFRKNQLQQTKKMLVENKEEIYTALIADLNWSRTECAAAFLDMYSQINYQLKNFEDLAKPAQAKVPSSLKLWAAWEIIKEPYGVVLIITPWNRPLCILINCMVGAIAAGNTVALKPSEISLNTTKIIAKLIPKYLDTRIVRVILGAKDETTYLLSLRFDKICYTGGGAVGRIVAMAAATHLTPTILELGGKCPVYVHKSANLALAAKRICWGKYMNCGQLCISPDYVLIDKTVIPKFIKELKAAIIAKYGENAKTSTSYCRIINEAHVDRIAAFLKDDHGGKVIYGGDIDRDARYISPTVVLSPREDSKLMQDEIFGPILSLILIDDGVEEAISYVNKRETPLSAYVFANSSAVYQKWEDEVSAGGISINDVVVHYLNTFCPFGGKGSSGMGNYRGPHSFDAFSHAKTVAKAYSFTDFILAPIRYKPHSEEIEKMYDQLILLPDEVSTGILYISLVAIFLAFLLTYVVDVQISLR